MRKTAGQRLNGLRWRLTAMRRLWSAGARPEMAFLAPAPFDAAPRGEVDGPGPGTAIEGEMLGVSGWAMFPSAPTTRVEVWLGDELLGLARVGTERADLKKLTENLYARVSGFELAVDLTEREERGDVTIRAIAISATGERLELDPVPVTIAPKEGGRASSKRRLAPPPERTPLAQGDGRRVLIYTHQLNLGGAQLYLMDLLRELLNQEAIRPTVVSAIDGVLREELEDLGVPVHLAGAFSMDDLGPHVGRLEELVTWASDRDFELVLINTATGFALPGAELAMRLGIPAVWAIHESFPLAVLWGEPDPRIRKLAEAALENASLVLFEAEATRKMFEARIGEGRGMVLPYGLDLPPIDAERASFDPASARRKAAIPEDAELVLCVGTVEPRKAQLPLVQAFDLIAARHPRARLAIVGTGDDPYSAMLAEYVESAAARERIDLIPVTPDVQRWYGMADLLVCASDVESLPRTVLEAMAWETPVLGTAVFGLPELIDDEETGWLCEPRDVSLLAEGLDRALTTPAGERRLVAERARRLVEERHALPQYAGRVSQLLDRVLAEARPSGAEEPTGR